MNFDLLVKRLQYTHDYLQASAAKPFNVALTLRNWLYGFYIVEYEQNGKNERKRNLSSLFRKFLMKLLPYR